MSATDTTEAPEAPDTEAPDTEPTGETAPKRGASRKRRETPDTEPAASARKPRKRSTGKRSLQRDLDQLFGTLGAAVSVVEPFDGAVLVANSGTLARRLDDLAKENDAIHRTLSLLTSGSGGAMGVAFALMPIVLPIAHHHRLIPSSPAVDALAASMTPPEAHAAESMPSLADLAAAMAATEAPRPGETPGAGNVTGSA